VKKGREGGRDKRNEEGEKEKGRGVVWKGGGIGEKRRMRQMERGVGVEDGRGGRMKWREVRGRQGQRWEGWRGWEGMVTGGREKEKEEERREGEDGEGVGAKGCRRERGKE